MKKKIIFSLVSFLSLPFLTFAATTNGTGVCDITKLGPPFKSLAAIISYFSCTLVGYVVPLLFTLATVAFIWGIIQFFLNPENEEGRQKGKSFMFWGIIALFVMISMWGLVGVLANTFGVKTLVPQLSQ